MFSKHLVHGHLAPWVWACSKVVHHGRSMWQKKVAHLKLEKKRKGRGSPLEGLPPPKGSATFQQHHRLADEPLVQRHCRSNYKRNLDIWPSLMIVQFQGAQGTG
jgi:hypothetical protein